METTLVFALAVLIAPAILLLGALGLIAACLAGLAEATPGVGLIRPAV